LAIIVNFETTADTERTKVQQLEQKSNYMPATEKEWRKLVTEWRRTELTAAEFCRRKLLVYHQFNQWKGKIDRIDAKYERAAQKVIARKRQLQREASRKTSPLKFAQVKLTEPVTTETAANGLAQPPTIELALPNGILVRLNDCSVTFLASVITALENH
jgi:hypothetical protein